MHCFAADAADFHCGRSLLRSKETPAGDKVLRQVNSGGAENRGPFLEPFGASRVRSRGRLRHSAALKLFERGKHFFAVVRGIHSFENPGDLSFRINDKGIPGSDGLSLVLSK